MGHGSWSSDRHGAWTGTGLRRPSAVALRASTIQLQEPPQTDARRPRRRRPRVCPLSAGLGSVRNSSSSIVPTTVTRFQKTLHAPRLSLSRQHTTTYKDIKHYPDYTTVRSRYVKNKFPTVKLSVDETEKTHSTQGRTEVQLYSHCTLVGLIARNTLEYTYTIYIWHGSAYLFIQRMYLHVSAIDVRYFTAFGLYGAGLAAQAREALLRGRGYQHAIFSVNLSEAVGACAEGDRRMRGKAKPLLVEPEGLMKV